MNTTLYPAELSNLITRVNDEIHEQIIDSLGASVGPNYVIGWNRAGDEDHLEIRCDTKMVEVRSIVVPFDVIDATTLSISLSGARLEVVGTMRVDSNHPWLRDHCFGEAGTLVLTLPGFDPEHSNAAAVVLAAQISKYLDIHLETC
jgi:hypothetical protein